MSTYTIEQIRDHALLLDHSGWMSQSLAPIKLAVMLRQGAEAMEAQRELRALVDTWPQHREASAKYASVDEVQSLFTEKDTEIARLKNDLKNREIVSALNFDTYVSDIEKRDAEISRLRDTLAAERAKVRELREWLPTRRNSPDFTTIGMIEAKMDALGLTGEDR